MTAPFSVLACEFRLEDLVSHVREQSDLCGWDSGLTLRVNLVLEELCLNVKSYGAVEGRRIDIWMVNGPSGVDIDFVDGGCPFDPVADAPDPDLTSPLGDREIGGLGLFLVRQMVDGFTYRRLDGANCIRLCLHASERSAVAPPGGL